MAARRRILRITLLLLSAVVLIFSLTIAWFWWESHQRRQRAEELLHDLEALEIGVSTESEAQTILERYDGEKAPSGYSEFSECYSKDPAYHVDVSSNLWLYGRPWLLRLLGPLGLRPWEFHSKIVVRGERILCVTFALYISRSDGLTLAAHVSAEPRPKRAPADYPTYIGTGMHFTGAPGNGLSVTVTDDATAEERQRTFDFNLDCLSGLGQCLQACELMAPVYRHRVHERRARGRQPLSSESDPHCQAVLAAGE